MVCLWSSDVLHALRIHADTFRATCPDPADRVMSWLRGSTPSRGTASALIVLDPFAEGRQRGWIDLETALESARPRYSDYASAASNALAARKVGGSLSTPRARTFGRTSAAERNPGRADGVAG
jgi:hypothetical protein